MLKFARPKGPGFGISAGYYLSVLSTRAALPPLLSIVNPHGEAGAVVGLGAPLASGAGKEALGAPLERGAYVLASKDRKTVLKLMVVPREEAGYDPEAVARHSESLGISGELLNRIRATWTLLQLRFESYDPAVYPALDFLLALAQRLGTQTDGVVADPVAQRYLLPEEIFLSPRANPLVDVREHVAVHTRITAAGGHAFTRGLQKFAMHELEIVGLTPDSQSAAERFLLGIGQRELEGRLLREGQTAGGFEVREGGLDRAMWEGIPCFELLPPTTMSAAEVLAAQQ